jgi:hypothetical protein
VENKYNSEIEGMWDFYEEINKIPDYECNTDGRINGTLLEFKKLSNDFDTNQLVRYLKAYNNTAKDIPAYSLHISLNDKKFIRYSNINFNSVIIQGEDWKTLPELLKFLTADDYILGYIDEFSIVSYNDKFYKIKNNKEDKTRFHR